MSVTSEVGKKERRIPGVLRHVHCARVGGRGRPEYVLAEFQLQAGCVDLHVFPPGFAGCVK